MKNLGDHYNNHSVYINRPRKVVSNCTSGNAFDSSGRETGKRRSITGTTSNKVLSVSRRADRVTMRFRLAINVLKPRLPAMWRILVINHARSWHVRRVNRVINIPSLSLICSMWRWRSTYYSRAFELEGSNLPRNLASSKKINLDEDIFPSTISLSSTTRK